MSSKGIYTALSGAIAQSAKLDTIANNLANVNTTSFKKDQQMFQEYLTAYEKNPDVIAVPRIPASIESFYDMQGGDKSFVDSEGTYTDFTQGHLQATGNTNHFGIDGKAFFEVLTPSGVRWTRNGSFVRNVQGQLATKEGHLVLREGQGDPAQRTINLGTNAMTVSQNGQIFSNGAEAGRLALVEFDKHDVLDKVGSSLYKLKNNAQVTPKVSTGVVVQQGYLEGSNVNIIQEMTEMIAASRVFESTQQAIKAFDQMDDKLINQVGKP